MTIGSAVVSSISRGGGARGLGRRAGDSRPGHDPAGDNSPTVGKFLGRVTGSATRGISVEVGDTQAAVDLTVTIPYGRSKPEISQKMRGTAIRRIENLTGLEVTEVNITVRDVFIPQQ